MPQQDQSQPAPRTDELLQMFDQQVRASVARRLPAGWSSHPDGAVLRVRTPQRGFAFTNGLKDLSKSQVGEAVDAALSFFARYDERFEWKTYSYDHPALTAVLDQHGFQPEPTETVLLGEAAQLADAGDPPAGCILRRVRERDDLERVAALETEVWGEDWSWLAQDLADRLSSSPKDIAVWVAEREEQVVSAAWLVRIPGTEFGGLWGGSTLEDWRHRGIYRALVAVRARVAEALGVRYLWVDASDDSRPILERLGLMPVATTTPWISPPPARVRTGATD
jgi:hypothetical protein